MKQGRKSQLVPVILIVIIVVVSVAAIVALAKTLFFNGGGNSQEQVTQQDANITALLETSPDRGVRMTVRGQITSDEAFRSYQVVITPSKRTMTTYAGYLGETIDSVSYTNNVQAYEQFVFALKRAGMAQGQQLQGAADDTRGICADGKVLEFELIQNDQPVQHLWTTTCRGAAGSLKASSAQLGDLFMDQIPASSDLLRKIHA